MKLYDYLYARNIKKYLLLNKKDFAIFGHLHKNRVEKSFAIIDTFHHNYFYEDTKVIVISDVHLGMYSYSDDELKKLKLLLSRQDKQIIILGDFFDLFYTRPTDIFLKYADLISIIKKQQAQSNLIYIFGNHDWNVSSLLGIPAVPNYNLANKIFFHGHICDPYHTFFPFNIFQKLRRLIGYRLHWFRPFYLKFNS